MHVGASNFRISRLKYWHFVFYRMSPYNFHVGCSSIDGSLIQSKTWNLRDGLQVVGDKNIDGEARAIAALATPVTVVASSASLVDLAIVVAFLLLSLVSVEE